MTEITERNTLKNTDDFKEGLAMFAPGNTTLDSKPHAAESQPGTK